MSNPYESRIDRMIREATERGDFDDLPGAGKPLPDRGEMYDEQWWLKQLALREDLSGALPPALAFRKEIQELPAVLDALGFEKDVRDHLRDLNHRIVLARRGPIAGPPVTVPTVDIDATVATWKAARAERHARRRAH